MIGSRRHFPESIRGRPFTRGIAFLLLLTGGAIINVAVAWGYVGLHGRNMHFAITVSDIFVRLSAIYADGSGMAVAPSERMKRNFIFDYRSSVRELRSEDTCVDDGWSARWRVGWPTRTLQCCFSGTSGTKSIQPHGMFSLLKVPVWPGFAINTIFYAAILWLLFATPGFIRRRVRMKPGLCPACAYPIGTSPVCTECGKPVKPKIVELIG